MDTTDKDSSPSITSRSDSPSYENLKRVMTLVLLTPRPDGTKPVFRLHKERLVIGTIVSADVRLTDPGVAPIHAVIELNAENDPSGIATIYDLASESGLFVNGARVVTQSVKAGDRIRVGTQELQFHVDNLDQVILRERTRDTGDRKLFLDSGEDLAPLNLLDDRYISQIFDYRPSQKRALEVVMSWLGTVLDVEHFVKESSVTIGTGRKSDFGIPPLLGQAKYAFVTRSGQSFTLNVEPQMHGVISRKGKLVTLDELRKGAGTTLIPLAEEDFAKISVGDVDFYLSFTSAPPRLKVNRLFEKDPFFYKILFTSFAMSAAMIGALIGTYHPKPIEAEEIPERLATILYQPEKFIEKKKPEFIPVDKTPPVEKPKVEVKPQPPKPQPQKTVKVDLEDHKIKPNKPVPKEMNVAPPKQKPAKVATEAKKAGADSKHQSEAKEGEGARAKGKEGSRGKPNAKAAPSHQDVAKRPSANGGQGAGGGHSQVEDIGNVDILKSATGKIQDILGSSAAKLGKGGEKIKGFGGFTSQGEGGLALSGSGTGGGGNAETQLGGLGNKGTGGGRVGTGRGAEGSGNGIIGGKARVALRTGGPEETVVMGTIDSDAVLAAIMAHKDEFRRCYEKEINADHPAQAGRVGTTFTIGSTGRVNQAGIASTTLNMAETESCILRVIKSIEFPIPRGAGIVQVSYPFKFNPVGNK